MQIQFRASPMFTNRVTKKIGWVFHGTYGSYQSAVNYLCTENRVDAYGRKVPPSSAHFVIGRNRGEVICLVKPELIAYHAGFISSPNKRFTGIAQKYPDGSYINPNEYLIGVEFAWGYDADRNGKVDAPERQANDWQLECFHALTEQYKDLCPVTQTNLVTHHDIASYKGDDLSADIERYYGLYPLAKVTPVAPTVPDLIVSELSLGDEGCDISVLQEFLRRKGFFTYFMNTEYFGQLTLAALKAFQKKYDLLQTGITDDATRAFINKIHREEVVEFIK